MSTSEKYVHSLKQIKESEEKAQKEVDELKKRVSEDFRSFEINTSKSIVTSKSDGERLVETSVDQARKKANTETEKIIDEATSKSKTISSRIDAQTVREIIDILLKEV